MSVKIVCWDTLDAPGPKISAFIGADYLPRAGEQIEFNDDVTVQGDVIPGGVYYVHKVRHVYDPGQNKFFCSVEVTDHHPGLS